MQDFSKCCSSLSKERESLKENRIEFIINNPEGRVFNKIKVDGCLKTNPPICDWLVCFGSKKLACYVELKGSNDIGHAVHQLRNTIYEVETYYKDELINILSESYRIEAYVVYYKFPPSYETRKQKNVMSFKRDKKNISLKFKETGYIYNL